MSGGFREGGREGGGELLNGVHAYAESRPCGSQAIMGKGGREERKERREKKRKEKKRNCMYVCDGDLGRLDALLLPIYA